MPIEIRELIIRAEVDAGGSPKAKPTDKGTDQNEIVQEVVPATRSLIWSFSIF